MGHLLCVRLQSTPSASGRATPQPSQTYTKGSPFSRTCPLMHEGHIKLLIRAGRHRPHIGLQTGQAIQGLLPATCNFSHRGDDTPAPLAGTCKRGRNAARLGPKTKPLAIASSQSPAYSKRVYLSPGALGLMGAPAGAGTPETPGAAGALGAPGAAGAAGAPGAKGAPGAPGALPPSAVAGLKHMIPPLKPPRILFFSVSSSRGNSNGGATRRRSQGR